ncbi:MAG: TetR family transcriptional regulator [Gaiellaceae bacterium]
MIQTEALRLFAEQGYAETTVEQIADAAAISPRTFFRYFRSKEDAVLWDEYEPLAAALLEARPLSEPPAESLRAVIRETLHGLCERDPEKLLVRLRLFSSVRELRARYVENGESLVAAFAQRRGHPPDELEFTVIGAAMIAALMVALDRWQRADGAGDLLELVDGAIATLASGARGLASTGH